MRSVTLAVLGVWGCSFAPAGNGAAAIDAGTIPDSAIDAGSAKQPTLPPNGSSTVPCSVSDPALSLCLDFEGSLTPTAVDSSTQDRDATTIDVSAIMRGSEQALGVTDNSIVEIVG